MQPHVDLVALDVENENHLRVMYSVRTHAQIVPLLRGPPPPDFSRHVSYLRNLDPQKKFFLIRSDSSLCGYCQLTYGAAQVEIGMALHPDFCNRGIGSQALFQLLARLIHNGKHPNIFLFVKKDNLRAIALYRKYGFERVGDENEWGEHVMHKSWNKVQFPGEKDVL